MLGYLNTGKGGRRPWLSPVGGDAGHETEVGSQDGLLFVGAHLLGAAPQQGLQIRCAWRDRQLDTALDELRNRKAQPAVLFAGRKRHTEAQPCHVRAASLHQQRIACPRRGQHRRVGRGIVQSCFQELDAAKRQLEGGRLVAEAVNVKLRGDLGSAIRDRALVASARQKRAPKPCRPATRQGFQSLKKVGGDQGRFLGGSVGWSGEQQNRVRTRRRCLACQRCGEEQNQKRGRRRGRSRASASRPGGKSHAHKPQSSDQHPGQKRPPEQTAQALRRPEEGQAVCCQPKEQEGIAAVQPAALDAPGDQEKEESDNPGDTGEKGRAKHSKGFDAALSG